jgi:acetyl-CoA synthetase
VTFDIGRDDPVPDLSRYDSYEAAREAFEWEIPETYNAGMDVVTRHADGPERTALYHETAAGETSRYTFRELERRSNELASALRDRGVERGDRVAVVAPQRVATALVHVAAYKLGAIAVPLSVLYGPDALEFRFADSETTAVFADPDVFGTVGEAVASVASVERVVGLGATPETPDGVEAERFADLRGARSFEPVATAPDDPALLVYTSGTTGRPKGVLQGHEYLLGHLPCAQMAFELPWHDVDPVLYTPADWAWVGGLYDALLPAWHYGLPVVGYRSEGFDAEATFELLETYDVTQAMLTPTMLKMMAQVDPSGYDLDSLVAIATGGEPVPGELHRWVDETFDVPLNELYGQTEANLVVSNCSQWFEPEPGCLGRPVPGHTVDVRDEDGSRLPAGEVGAIAVRTPDPVVFQEYWNAPDLTAASFFGPDDEWMDTDDIGYRDADGRLWFTARDDDVIITSGYRVGPAEVEDVLLEHEAVANAAVIGVDDETRDRIVKAYVVPAAEAEPSDTTAEAIQQYVRENLAKYQYPRELAFIDELPKTTTGKIQRYRLRERHEAESG